MSQPWETPIQTAVGPVRLSQVVNHRLGHQDVYAFLAEQEVLTVGPLDRSAPGSPVLLGYLSVDLPTDTDPDLRKEDEPTDRRINTIWLHPAVRDRGVGRALGNLIKHYRLYDSHSTTRTEAGSRWASAVGDAPAPTQNVPDDVEFDSGGRTTYRLLLHWLPDVIGLHLD